MAQAPAPADEQLAQLAVVIPVLNRREDLEATLGSLPAVGELIDTLAKKYPIDPARIYLIGFSLGGMGSWEVALDQPDRFAAVVPIGGRMGSPADAARLKEVPIWVFNGADDPTTTTAEAQIMADAIRSAGGNPRFTVLPDTAHGDSQDKAYRYPGMFKWMLEQRRDR